MGDIIIISHCSVDNRINSICEVLEVAEYVTAYCFTYKVRTKDGSILWADGFLHSPLMEELI